ncbi:Remorin, C-terminal [Trema orientale]|uniref:Remorin, C-terminal n=1 Tax=Trema orientale TaxID=63057 RepID=A0A2P5C9K6_TREOI|nr:Remorin, C-terminal [Trema orientale]
MINRRTTRTSFTQIERTTLRTEPAIDSTVSSKSSNNGQPSFSRTFANSRRTIAKSSDWSLNSLMEALPESPSPVCSAGTTPLSSRTSSPKSNAFFSQLSTESSTPRSQSYSAVLNGIKLSRFYHPDTQNNYPQAIEESSVPEEFSHQSSVHGNFGASDGGSPDGLQHNLMTRPKPYSTFLDEVKKQELEAEKEARRKTKQSELIDKLTRKEAAINEWEHKQTSKIVEEMKRLESKLEKKRARALEKFQRRISITKAEANKMTTKARRETIEKISEISKISSRAQDTKNSTCVKLIRFC